MSFSLPGVEKADIRLECDEDTLTVSGKRRDDDESAEAGRREQARGAFMRRVVLPAASRLGQRRGRAQRGAARDSGLASRPTDAASRSSDAGRRHGRPQDAGPDVSPPRPLARGGGGAGQTRLRRPAAHDAGGPLRRGGAVRARGRGHGVRRRRAARAGAHGARGAGADLRESRPIPVHPRRPAAAGVPPRAGPAPGPRAAVPGRRGAPHRGGRARRAGGAPVRALRDASAGRGVHRPGPRRGPARRRGGGREGAAPGHPRARGRGPRHHGAPGRARRKPLGGVGLAAADARGGRGGAVARAGARLVAGGVAPGPLRPPDRRRPHGARAAPAPRAVHAARVDHAAPAG